MINVFVQFCNLSRESSFISMHVCRPILFCVLFSSTVEPSLGLSQLTGGEGRVGHIDSCLNNKKEGASRDVCGRWSDPS